MGEEFEYNGVKLRVEREVSEFSCEGCYMKMNCSKGRTGCSAKSVDRHIFGHCKRDHVIFVRV